MCRFLSYETSLRFFATQMHCISGDRIWHKRVNLKVHKARETIHMLVCNFAIGSLI